MSKIKLPRHIAHRGLSHVAPENTFPAFEAAKQAKAQWLECDVQLTQDNKPVIFHDDQIERTTNGQGLLTKKTLAQLQQLDAGSWFSPKFANCQIPQLEETLLWLEQNQMGANIEIKAGLSPKQDKKTSDHCVELLLRYHDKIPILVSSASTLILQQLRDYSAKFNLALIVHDLAWPNLTDKIAAIEQSYNHLDLVSIHLSDDNCNQQLLQSCRFADQLAVFTVNDSNRAADLFAWGATGVFTDGQLLAK